MHKTSRAEVHRWNFVMVQLVRERRWRSRGFTTKTQARQFYEGRKLEQREGRFFPNQYQRRGQVTFEQVISDYMATSTKRSQKEDRRYAKLWTSRFTTHRSVS